MVFSDGKVTLAGLGVKWSGLALLRFFKIEFGLRREGKGL
jgi:hypothetical protein